MRPMLIALAATALVAAAGEAAAQTYTTSLRGIITDAKGVVVPGVTVTAIDMAKGVSRHTLTNTVGQYWFPAIVPGCYVVTAAVPGYKTYERPAVCVSTATPVSLDISLETGSTSTVVTGEAPVRIATASTGEVMSNREFDTIPNAYHNIYWLWVTLPNPSLPTWSR